MLKERDPNLVGGLIKGLRIIEAFDNDRSRLSISEVSALTRMDRATCRRLLLTLVSLGYAEHDSKFFKLTPRVLLLGYAYLHTASLPNVVQPLLEQLSRETDESCSASVLDGQAIVYIARASRRRVMSINLSVGSRLPAYCSSMGRVLLANMPPERARAVLLASELRRFTPTTLVDVDRLMAELVTVRAQNYAIIDEELELGLRSIAVPLINNRGTVVAAINVGAQAARVSLEKMRDVFLPHLLRAQADLRRLLAPE
jgi:IclR family pca regulon transcriptional regulator